MKPAPFDYVRPETLAQTCQLLAADENARVIAGGQTLVPMLAMRLARPTQLIDILRIPGLSGIRAEGGTVVVGATTRQVEALHSPVIHASVPLLAQALPWVGHPPTRNRGTVGGSLANGDPSAEIPLVAVTLNADIVLATTAGETAISADDFYIGPMLTAIDVGQCVSAVRFPVWSERRIGVGFQEISARKSDFAFVSAAAQVALDDGGRCTAIVAGIGGAAERPTRLDLSQLIGMHLEEATVTEAVAAATADMETMTDLHASAAYRRRVATAMGARAVLDAARDAGENDKGIGR
ncbi:MAG: FAD binding domain-containing protein [Xanthobacteraceae bacterium]